MKSWHITLNPQQVTTATSREADVVRLSDRFFCLDCENAQCLHIGFVLNFLSRPEKVAEWKTISVREDDNNPHARQKVELLRERVRNRKVWLRLTELIDDTLRTIERLKTIQPEVNWLDEVDRPFISTEPPSPFELIEL